MSDEQAAMKQGYWRSLSEYAELDEFRTLCRDEFASDAAEAPSPFSRRSFMKLLGASVALAGMSGCRWPQEKIVPHAHRPEGFEPGKTKRFATAMELGGVAAGLLVTSYEGRPIKIEGNPEHPINGGAADVLAQASILELYDPERSRSLVETHNGVERPGTWTEFEAWAARLGEQGGSLGEGLAVLSEASSSVSLAAQRKRFLAEYPRARWHEYEPLSDENILAGSRLACGRPLRPLYRLDRARVILALDADLFGGHSAALRHARDFVSSRDPHGEMSRLYAVESSVSVTGAMADHRLPMPAARIVDFSIALAVKLFELSGSSLPGDGGALLRSLASRARDDFNEKWLTALAEDLLAHAGESVVAVGERQPPLAHALGQLMNELLRNFGTGVELLPLLDEQGAAGFDSISQLAGAMGEGEIRGLLILGGNPAYDAPADLDFADLLERIPATAHLSLYRNETSRLCRWHLPRAHYLETWSEARAADGTLCSVQPLIEPLYGGRNPAEIVASLLGDERPSAHELSREALRGSIAGDFEAGWRRFLHDGFLAGSAASPVAAELDPGSLIRALAGAVGEAGELHVEFVRDGSVHDGRFANNGWLQELPDAISKLTWDNAALISPATARRLDVETGDMLSLKLAEREIEIPALLVPGQAADTLALPLGYGRRGAGGVGNAVGVDTYALRTTAAPSFAIGVQVRKTGGKQLLALTQDHHLIDRVGYEERERRTGELVRETDHASFQQDPHSLHGHGHHPPLKSLWEEHDYAGHRWGMSIDLNACIGCNACVVACQAENNIPVVGKREVARGREMHWIRLDRYFKGDPENPVLIHQPVACSQCELAPCEQVCPVAATVHSDEGLNDMVYNRCVGTRYCANNCPFKVRRFNYFNFHAGTEEVEKLGYNPEVTVRSRGVMEKCSYCVQRIQAVKIQAKNEGRSIADGEIVPACAQTCPTRAIRFGDLNGEDSAVRVAHGDERAYMMLAELNIKPRTAYLGRIRNPNPRLSGVEDHGHRDH